MSFDNSLISKASEQTEFGRQRGTPGTLAVETRVRIWLFDIGTAKLFIRDILRRLPTVDESVLSEYGRMKKGWGVGRLMMQSRLFVQRLKWPILRRFGTWEAM